MNKKAVFAFTGIFLFLFIFNYLHPLSFGDDYLYSFVWQGKPMFSPLTEEAVRVSSLHDLIVSQWSHYFTWGGRTVAHVLAQLFLWAGKNVFNIFNALIGTVLVAEIYWCIYKGQISLKFQPGTLIWIFFSLWAFTPGFSPVFFWLTSSCNYLWTNTILLGFLLPYIQKYYNSCYMIGKNICFDFSMFFGGIIAGWTNENSICWILLLLFVFIMQLKKEDNDEIWIYTGFVGLLAGYTLLMLAPGNIARLLAEQGSGNWLTIKVLKENFNMLFMILFFQLFLWYFNLRAIYSLEKTNVVDSEFKKEFLLAKVLCLTSFGMSAMMIASPGFPPRSGFSGTVFLIVASGTLLRTQKEYGISLIQNSAKKFLSCVGLVYFALTVTVTFYHFCTTHVQMESILQTVKQERIKSGQKIIVVHALKETNQMTDILSGFHIPGFELSEDENNWVNVAFARYYGIKGIRMVKDKEGSVDREIKDKSTLTTETSPAKSRSR